MLDCNILNLQKGSLDGKQPLWWKFCLIVKGDQRNAISFQLRILGLINLY